ncbi:MAG TPA: DUF2231 domain-containing protein [Actinomycetota bacterium]|nr:DUF2231 domain-containing protein [Actinomycetota bacterium]
MPVSLKHRSPTGETRPWTVKEILQGKPIGHPSHPMFVHFPIAFYLAALAFDVMSRITPSPGLVMAATYLILGAAGFTVILAITGLIDWWGMVRGSDKRRIATRHMLLQLLAGALFQATLVLRWSDRSATQARGLWIALEVVGFLVITVAQYLGGVLVYEKAMRVHTGVRTSPPMDVSPGAR